MRKQLLCTTAAIAVTAAMCVQVYAADMAVKSAYQAPPPPVQFTWTGLYFGAHMGYGSAKFEFNTGLDRGGRTSSTIGGAQLGFNYQTGNVVWGVEGDITGASFNGGMAGAFTATIDQLGSIRGRLGLAFDRILFYGTAGAGYESGKAYAQTFGQNLSVGIHKGVGVFGGGVEYAFTDHLTARVEALDYTGSTQLNLGGDLNNSAGNIWVVRGGLNFKI